MAAALSAACVVSGLAAARCAAEEAAAEKKKPEGASDWSEKKFLHPPLACNEGYKRVNEFPVIAWAFHGVGSPGYIPEYVRQAKDCGFNGILDGEIMLKCSEPFEGMMVMVAAFKYAPERIEGQIFKRFGDHPRLLGFVLDDNNMGFIPVVQTAAKYIKDKYPHTIPWVSENPNPGSQSRTAMRILGTQNYEMYRGAYVRGYCDWMERDRRAGLHYNMSYWTIFSAPCSDTEYRFQVNAAVAFGAQGLVTFAYCPGDRWPEWRPGKRLANVAAYSQNYIREVVGWRVWGCRTTHVLHSKKDGDTPNTQGRVGEAHIVQDMDARLLVGFLTPEAQMKDKDKLPLYAMFVDKRVARNDKFQGFALRTAHIQFNPIVKIVEVFPKLTGTDKDEIRVIEPAWSVPLELLGGDALLVRLNPDGLDAVLGPDAAAYVKLIDDLAALRAKTLRKEIDAAEFDKVFGQARQAVAAMLEKKGTDLAAQQRQDTLPRLAARMEELRVAALQPEITTPAGPFPGSVEVVVQSSLKGSDIRYTIDGSEPTLKSPRYTGPVKLANSATIRVRAASSDPAEMVGQEVSAELTKVKTQLLQPHRINFQPKDAAAQAGMLVDSGQQFGARESGFAYGWSEPRVKAVSKRDKNEDQALDTIVDFAPNVEWKHMVENGDYEVTVSVGDPAGVVRGATLLAEETKLCSDVTLEAGKFEKFTQTVSVADGELTLKMQAAQGGARKGKNNQPRLAVNWVEIRKK